MITYNRDRIFGLDILRSVAILLVVFQHSILIFRYHSSFYKFLSSFVVIDGVTLFFVLSGFLIGGILIKTFEKEELTFKKLSNFWIRRWFRTLPNYFLILTFIVFFFLISENQLVGFNVGYYFFVHNFIHSPSLFFPESWSLSVEEWFYLLFPVLLFLIFFILKFNFRRTLFLSIILLGSFSVISRIIVYALSQSSSELLDFHYAVIYRFDSIAVGVGAAYLSFYKNEFWIKYRKHFLFGSAILFVLYVPVKLLFKSSLIYFSLYDLIVESFIVFLLLPFLSKVKVETDNIVIRSITTISIISYSMYLLNYTVIFGIIMPFIFEKKFSSHIIYYDLMRFFVHWGLTFVLSYFLYVLYEKPMTDLREKFIK